MRLSELPAQIVSCVVGGAFFWGGIWLCSKLYSVDGANRWGAFWDPYTFGVVLFVLILFLFMLIAELLALRAERDWKRVSVEPSKQETEATDPN